MTLIPERRKCSVCGKIYSWNPDVGKICCPYCRGIKIEGEKKRRGIPTERK
jgi:hypothetical protein